MAATVKKSGFEPAAGPMSIEVDSSKNINLLFTRDDETTPMGIYDLEVDYNMDGVSGAVNAVYKVFFMSSCDSSSYVF